MPTLITHAATLPSSHISCKEGANNLTCLGAAARLARKPTPAFGESSLPAAGPRTRSNPALAAMPTIEALALRLAQCSCKAQKSMGPHMSKSCNRALRCGLRE
eukprot:15441571-Alexandrium_andersonii.AAC.1